MSASPATPDIAYLAVARPLEQLQTLSTTGVDQRITHKVYIYLPTQLQSNISIPLRIVDLANASFATAASHLLMDWNNIRNLEAGGSLVSPPTPMAEDPKEEDIKPSMKRNTKLAADFMSYDSDHWVFRRFEKLSLFNILSLQQELVNCESELNLALRKEWMATKEGELDPLVTKIRSKLKEYGITRHSTYPRRKQD